MKISILGHGGHGKDTVAEIIRDMAGLKFVSSSEYCCSRVVYPALRSLYASEQECFNDRRNNREIWARLISSYNTPDKARLAKGILNKSDMYVGMRCIKEYRASSHLFDTFLFVDASDRVPPDPTMTIPFNQGFHYRIDNNGSLANTENQIRVILGLSGLKTNY